MKVFLGGTCSGWKWRNPFQKMLKCDYYNPIVKNWTEEDRLREVDERLNADYIVYGITNGIRGVYSIAEVVDDSHQYPTKTIFLNLYQERNNKKTKQMAHSLAAVEKLLEYNGVKIFSGMNAMRECAAFLNKEYDRRRKLKERKK